MRVRRAAHLVDDAYIAKFKKAVELMRALPEDDPRSFKQQANVHCAYCAGAYNQAGFTNLKLQIHRSWLFFPFHRYYIYFFERILGKLINDTTFALPFWNYDSPGGMTIPSMFIDTNSSLYDSLRDSNHQPPTIVDLNYAFSDSDNTTTPEEQMIINLKIVYRQMVSSAKTPQLFFGRPYRRGDQEFPGVGSIELVPHGMIHLWTGSENTPYGENMGAFYSTARDPIFFAHHSNVDRMWSIWKTLGGPRRTDLTDPDFLDASFVFYDENAEMVRVKVRDCLDEKKLGYVYQDVEIPWLNTRPTPKVSPSLLKKFHRTNTANPRQVFPAILDRVLKVIVTRPKKTRSRKEKDELEEILVIEGIELERDHGHVKFDVYINADEDDLAVISPENAEFAGSFVSLWHKPIKGKRTKTQLLTLSICDILEDLDADEDDYVLVTLVPRNAGDAIKIHNVKIELDG
ncbi:tyrosinase family protein [Acinetobacter baumannii]